MAEAPLTDKQKRRSDATVFLGGGRITSALLAGLRLARYRRPIVVHDRHVKKLRALERQFHIEAVPDLTHAMQRAEMLIIAVRPDSVAKLLGEVRRTFHRPLLAVSLAAGVPLRQLRARLGVPVRWVRAMPSPVCRVGRGLTGIRRTGRRAGQVDVMDIGCAERDADADEDSKDQSHDGSPVNRADAFPPGDKRIRLRRASRDPP